MSDGDSFDLDAKGLSEAFVAVLSVIEDHASALNRLDLGETAESDGFPEPGAASAGDHESGSDNGEAAAMLGDDHFANQRDSTAPAGTDLAGTLAAGLGSASGERDLTSFTSALYAGARDGAAGSAGISLTEVFGGLSEALTNSDSFDGERFALGLESAAERLAPSGDGASPGTMPTVVAAAAMGALRALDDGLDLADVVISAADEGLSELENGPVANPRLADRGVVDAASAGFLLVLDSLAAFITGDEMPSLPAEPASSLSSSQAGSAQFIVRCRLEFLEGCGIESLAWLESAWHEIGEVVRCDKVRDRPHLELVTSLPGMAIEALCRVGVPTELHIGTAAE